MVDGAVQSNSVVRRRPAAMVVGLLALGLLLGLVALWAAPSANAAPGGDKVVALTTGDRLATFDKDAPGRVLSRVAVKGLQEGETLVGMDFRPANGKLYAIGDTSQVYVINRRTGQATASGEPFVTPLAGNVFGVDFNPTVDRIRVVSDQDQNLRVNPAGGPATVDPPLQYAAADENAGENPNVTAVAYTNNRASAFGTTDTVLYDIDAGLDILTTQNPANNGTLNTVGDLGVDPNGVAGFDTAPGYGALAAVKAAEGESRLVKLNLETGDATNRGMIGTRADVKDIAIPLPVPAN